MIISASYKTDIPTFYGEWFMNRLRAGYCKMVNPYGGQIYEIPLKTEDVDGFVFWTKNIGPFLKCLPEVRNMGYPFIVQHTITGYPRELESRVMHAAQTVEYMKILAHTYGPQVAVWRYDPIVVSSLTPVDWHKDNFEKLAQSLEGVTDEVVVSFAQIYKKTRRNMNLAAQEAGFSWTQHEEMAGDSEQVRLFILELAHIAHSYHIQLRVCSQERLLTPGLVEEARCIDAGRLERVANRPILEKSKQKGNRKECACFASKDIGEYDTCPHGCVYCYAVQHRELALSRYRDHDPTGAFLFRPTNAKAEADEGEESSKVIPVAKITKRGQSSSAKPDEVEQGQLW